MKAATPLPGSEACPARKSRVYQVGADRRVPEIMREDVREILVRNYRIVYKIDGKVVWIVTVFVGHQPRDIIEPI